MFRFFILSLCLIHLLFSSVIIHVKDRITKEPLPKKSIVVFHHKRILDEKTNDKGNFSLTGTGTFQFTIIDKVYGGKEVTLNIEEKVPSYTIYFIKRKKKLKKLKEVQVNSSYRIPMGGRVFDSKLLNESVQFSGFSDVLSTVKKLPGITFSPQFTSGALFIQGGDGSDWIGRFNGVYIYDPLVWDRLISMFNPTYTDSLTLYTSAFPSFFPNALSGAIDIKVKEFKNIWKGYLDFNVTSVSFYAGGPINKDKTANMFAYLRRSLLELVIPLAQTSQSISASEYPNTWDGGLIFNIKANNDLKIQQLNWFIVSGINIKRDESEEIQEEYKNIPDFNPKQKQTENKEYKGVHSLQFLYDLSLESKLNITLSIIPNYTFFTISDNGVNAVDQSFLLLENQLNISANIPIGNHILTVGGTLSYFYYQSSINDYSTIINNKGKYEKYRTIDSNKNHRVFISPFFNADLSLINNVLRLNLGGNLSYSSINKDIFFNPNIKLSFSPKPFSQLYIGTGLYNRTDQKLYSKLKSQKVVHTILGASFSFPKVKFGIEGFYKYFWDLPIKQSYSLFFSDVDRSNEYDSVGIKHAFGFGTNIVLFDSPKSIISGEIAYTWQMAYRKNKKSDRARFNGINVQSMVIPPTDKLYKDLDIRNHTLTFSIKIKPFIKIPVKSKYNKPIFYGAFHNYISLNSYFLTGLPSPVTDGIQQIGTINTIKFGDINGTTTPLVYKLDIQWTFPILGPDIQIFLIFRNITNTEAILRKEYKIKDGKIIDNDRKDFIGFLPGLGFKIYFPFRKKNP